MVLDHFQTKMDRLFGCSHCLDAKVYAAGPGGHVVGQDDSRSEAEGQAASLKSSMPLTSEAAPIGGCALHAFQLLEQMA